MLSEAYVLWQALERATIPLDQSHPDVKSPGKAAPCLRVTLDARGHVNALDPVTDDERPGLWTVMEGNHNSFPVVRLREPLLRLSLDDPLWGQLGYGAAGKRKVPPKGQVRSVLLDALARVNVGGPPKGESDLELWNRLKMAKVPRMLEVAASSPDLDTLRRLVERFAVAVADLGRLYSQMAQVSAAQLSADVSTAEELRALLVGEPGKQDDPRRPPAVQLAFDTDNARTRLYTEQTRTSLNRAMLRSDAVTRERAGGSDAKQPASKGKGRGAGTHPGMACAFTGEGSLQVEPFPEVRLPVLEQYFSLVAMFQEAKCNTRYGLTGALVVPVSQDTALRLHDALKWIVAAERKGKTWRAVASGRFQGRREKQDLLIAYAEDRPAMPGNVTALFAARSDDPQSQYEADATAACAGLSGLAQAKPRSRLSLFVLRAVSRGQVQVVLAETPSVRQVLDGAEWWQTAACNVPPIAVPVWRAREKQWDALRPRVPYPDQVVRILSGEWARSGTHCNAVGGIALGEVLSVMLRTGSRHGEAAGHMLSLAVQRSGALLVGLTGALHTDRWSDRKLYPDAARLAALGAASVLGIMLYALGERKEDYMLSQPFLVGRLLALADTLHREYCRHVRGDSVPPQLIGNAMMRVAADNPEDAVGRLGERMAIYTAWATKADGDEVGLAKWCLGQLGEVCRQLASQPLPRSAGPTERAELFLGYMARMKHEKTDGADTAETKEVEGNG